VGVDAWPLRRQVFWQESRTDECTAILVAAEATNIVQLKKQPTKWRLALVKLEDAEALLALLADQLYEFIPKKE